MKMLKQVVATVISAAALTLPLAGTASAEPSTNNNGVGAKGVPGVIASTYPPNPANPQVPPGDPTSGAANTKDPGTSLPDAYGGPSGQQLKSGYYGGQINNGYNGGPPGDPNNNPGKGCRCFPP
jgi:hypothetical protein